MHSDKFSDMGEVFFALCKSVNSPVSLGAWLRYKYSHTELASMDINPRHYTSASAFKYDYAVVSFLSKFKGLHTGIDLEAVALQKFKQSEDQCRETNKRFRHIQTADLTPSAHSVLYAAQLKIASVLGRLDISSIVKKCGYGPGATFELPRRMAQVDRKLFELPISVSRTAYPLFKAVVEDDLHWSSSILGVMPEGNFSLLPSCFKFVDACRIETVPKNAKTHRIIAVEPRGNGFLQKGVGDYIRKRLRRVGIDLDNQGRNQFLASQALNLSLATLDLKAASDTVSKELVYHLLPHDWAILLDNLRSRLAILPDKTYVVLEKFSSMGNGFTFELETLIFWALSSALSEARIQRGVVAVYGDDIIVNANIADELISTLNICGFTINDQKSFKDGLFYESCGFHFFDNINVTPAYQKELLSDQISLIRCGNRLIRLAFRLGGYKCLDISIRGAWETARRKDISSHLYAIPFSLDGDDAWALPYSEFPFSKWTFRPSRSGSFDTGMGLRCRTLKSRNVLVPGHEPSLLAVSMRRTKDRLRDPFVTDESTTPFGGDVEIVSRTPVWVSSNRRVIPAGVFSVAWR